MQDKKKLIIECGPDSLAPFKLTANSSLLDQISSAKRHADSHNIDLEITIYSSIMSQLSGGREKVSSGKVMNKSLFEMEKIIDSLNSNGILFNLTLNGGLRFDLDLDARILHELDPALSLLVNIGRAHGAKNFVTITHPRLFDFIKQEYSELGTIASCIQTLYPFYRYDYSETFKKYDYVVPLNQHATPRFLAEYKNYYHKMILFLTLGCGTSNLKKCYLHYFEIESEYILNNETTKPLSTKLLNPIQNQLTENDYDCDNGDLLSRENDLIGMILMRVNKFKIPRNGVLKKSSFLKLINFINKYGP